MLASQLFASASAMNFGDWVGAAQNLVQMLAIAVAALWGYYKFVRGRTFHRRAEVGLNASLLGSDSSWAIYAQATLENTGGSDIPLRAKAVKIRSFRRGDLDERGRPQWRDTAIAPVFADHEWIESQEAIADDVLVPLRAEDSDRAVLAFRVTCVVYERRRRKPLEKLRLQADPGGGVCWTTNTIVPAGLAAVQTVKLRERGEEKS
jgi:hypothetical protein